MARQLDKAIVIDVEATCWEKGDPQAKQSEIIEIGVCVIDLKIKLLEESESILISPQLAQVSEYCTNLTSLTQDMLDQDGIAFGEACSLLRKKYNTKNRLWISWGDYDRRQFERQCSANPLRDESNLYPFGPTHLNLKNFFALDLGLDHEVGMDEALRLWNMELEGTHHRGIDDARNIAKIACRLFS